METATSLDSSLQSDIPVLIDFWAPWCGPCKRMEPALEEVSQKFAGKVKIVKINIDECPDLAAKLNVMSIPTFSLYNDGQEVARRVGAMSAETLSAMISDLLLDLDNA